jgi:hypothetical protein
MTTAAKGTATALRKIPVALRIVVFPRMALDDFGKSAVPQVRAQAPIAPSCRLARRACAMTRLGACLDATRP